MPSNVAVLRNLTFQKEGAGSAVDLQNWPRIFLELKEGGPHALAEVRGTDHTTPYHEGQYEGVWRRDRLPILLEGVVAGTGADEDAQRSDTATARMEMHDLFDNTATAGVLSVETEDGTVWTISARPEILVWEADPPVPTYQPLTVRLIALDPPTWEEGS